MTVKTEVPNKCVLSKLLKSGCKIVLCFCHRRSEFSLIVKKQQQLPIDQASQNGPLYFSSNEVHYTKETLNKHTCEQFYICHSVIL